MILKKEILLLFFVYLFLSLSSYSQGEFETTREPDNYNMNSFGIKLNSNGFGCYYSFSQRINFRLRRFYEAEYNFLKDSKELKVVNDNVSLISPRTFVFGKVNSVHNLKFGYGYNKMIFEKRDKSSISIHLLGSVGFSLCLSKPIYYETFDLQTKTTEYKKFDINAQNGNFDIIGKGPFSKGINELQLHPGIYGKFGIAFDFSRDIMRTNTLEIGGAFDAYLRQVEIMAENKKTFFLSLYVMYNFGQKYNANLNREFRREQRKQERKNT